MKQILSFLLLGIVLLLVLAACGSTGEYAPPSMSHGSNMGNTPGMIVDPLFDAKFIDSMIQHHQGAINMANQALKDSQHPELKQFAQKMITTQQNEINQMSTWRQLWYPDQAPTSGMGMPMGEMQIAVDTSKPFDLRFIEAMISHHQAAINMAKVAQPIGEHAEIRQLATAIVSTQEAEIKQLNQWKSQWYPGQS